MATRCFGRGRLTIAAAMPLLFSFRRAVGFVGGFRFVDELGLLVLLFRFLVIRVLHVSYVFCRGVLIQMERLLDAFFMLRKMMLNLGFGNERRRRRHRLQNSLLPFPFRKCFPGQRLQPAA